MRPDFTHASTQCGEMIHTDIIQGDNHGIHCKRWSLSSASPVKTMTHLGGLFVSVQWKPWIIMTLILRSSVAPDAIKQTTPGANNDEKWHHYNSWRAVWKMQTYVYVLSKHIITWTVLHAFVTKVIYVLPCHFICRFCVEVYCPLYIGQWTAAHILVMPATGICTMHGDVNALVFWESPGSLIGCTIHRLSSCNVAMIDDASLHWLTIGLCNDVRVSWLTNHCGNIMYLTLSLMISVGLSAGIQSAGDWVSETLWVRILHSAEEDNLSPFDSKIDCLCQSIEINNNNNHVFDSIVNDLSKRLILWNWGLHQLCGPFY